MYYGEIKKRDIANGIGVRVSLFVSGCTHHCKGCFNEETWNFQYGQIFTKKTQEQILKWLEPDYVSGLTILGGEPMEFVNQQELLPFLKEVKKRYPEKNIWCYTGYVLEKDILEKNGAKVEGNGAASPVDRCAGRRAVYRRTKGHHPVIPRVFQPEAD